MGRGGAVGKGRGPMGRGGVITPTDSPVTVNGDVMTCNVYCSVSCGAVIQDI